MSAELELFGTAACPHTAELRERLQWQGRDFVEHRVDEDRQALARMLELTGGRASVPVLVEGGRVKEIGFRGRSCPVDVGEVPTAGPGSLG